jgi:hypothetical protein
VDNPFVQMQEKMSNAIVEGLTAWGEARDKMVENLFMVTFGSPLLQALVGLRASDGPPRRRPGEEPEHLAFVTAETERLKGLVDQGGVREAMVRALIYALAPQKATDERSFNMMRQLRQEYGSTYTLAQFKALVREQAQLLQIDDLRAVAAIPQLLAQDPKLAARMIGDLRRVVTAGGPLGELGAARLAEIEGLFAQVVPAEAPAISEAEMAAGEPDPSVVRLDERTNAIRTRQHEKAKGRSRGA